MDAQYSAHHHHDMPEWGRELWDAVWHVRAQYDRHTSRLNRLESRMADQQAEIDADVTAINDAVSNIQAELAALQQQQPQLDLSALDAAVSQLSQVAPAPAPVDPNTPPAAV